ncbi:hypothetical protein CTA2_1248 [Colletotrichum tanaceti]|uniref:Uncharacterized protein n=1 Tax=Colletotrichum tanaceti TaxID=1306861 RepID=A0A4U6XJ07_9PEZI|nr:hypothetical protein CTA2_1248 [Colletotrichum tanaceti]TKW55479.1 hypothetical protein CTA1_3568 [Colletotrichum tanaceti]
MPAMADEKRRRSRGEAQNEWLDRLRHTNSKANNDSDFFQLMKEAAEVDLSAIGFRHAAVSTQQRQDRILNDYRGFVRIFKNIPDPDDGNNGSSSNTQIEKDLDLECFPSPESCDEPESFNALWRLIRPYLYFVAESKIPRSNAHNIISYTTLCQYRKALMFWVPRKYDERGIKPPLHRHVFNQMTEMLRCLAVQKKLSRFNFGADAKVGIGLDDIRQLIDMDLQDTVSIELSEQHHFAICLARACALRPGSLGMSHRDSTRGHEISDELPFLAWKDIRVTRGHQQGMWTLRVTIRNLKTNKDLDAEAAETANRRIRFRITSPQQQSNLALSVPHRLLVIGLRRGVFEEIATIDDLFETDLHQISIKEEFLDKPILLAGAERGLGLKDDHTPLPSSSLTKWLKLRAERIGWPGDVTFYSIRRQTASTYVNALGVDNARALMAHEPDSRTLERFYVDCVSTTDVSAIALGEEVGHGGADELMHLEATTSVTLDRLPADKIVHMYGPELNALFRQYVRADAGYPTLSLQEKKNRDRVLRRKAFLVLRSEVIELYQKRQTAGERQMRKEEILGRATLFNKRLLEAFAEEQSGQDVENLATVDFEAEFEADSSSNNTDTLSSGVQLENEADAEDQAAHHDGEITIPEELQFTDSAVNCVEAAAAIPYETAVKLAMRVMLDHELGEYRPQGNVICPHCQDDDTVDDEKKSKTYTVGNLRGHVASDFHTRYKQWQRRALNNRDGRYLYCQYCVRVHPEGDSEAFQQLKQLTRHIRRSTANRIAGASDWTTPELSAEHEELKRQDGWYDEDWAVNLSLNVQLGTSRRAKIALAARKTQVKKQPPVPVTGHPGFLWATPGQEQDQEHEQEPDLGIVFGSAPGMKNYEPSMIRVGSGAGVIANAPPPGTPGWIPTFSSPPYRGIVMVPTPGTEGNMPGDGLLMSDWVKGKLPSAHALRSLALM